MNDKTVKLGLDESDPSNKVWRDIYKESALLLDRIDKIHLRLGGVIKETVPVYELTDLIKVTTKDYNSIYKDFNKWWLKVSNYLESPELVTTGRVDSIVDQILGPIQYLSLMRDRRKILEDKMNNFLRDFYMVISVRDNRKSNSQSKVFFSVGIAIALIAVFISIYLSLVSIFLSIK